MRKNEFLNTVTGIHEVSVWVLAGILALRVACGHIVPSWLYTNKALVRFEFTC